MGEFGSFYFIFPVLFIHIYTREIFLKIGVVFSAMVFISAKWSTASNNSALGTNGCVGPIIIDGGLFLERIALQNYIIVLVFVMQCSKEKS